MINDDEWVNFKKSLFMYKLINNFLQILDNEYNKSANKIAYINQINDIYKEQGRLQLILEMITDLRKPIVE